MRITGKDLFRKLLKVRTPCELLVTLGIDPPSNMRAFYSLTMEEFLELKEEQVKVSSNEARLHSIVNLEPHFSGDGLPAKAHLQTLQGTSCNIARSKNAEGEFARVR